MTILLSSRNQSTNTTKLHYLPMTDDDDNGSDDDDGDDEFHSDGDDPRTQPRPILTLQCPRRRRGQGWEALSCPT